MGEKGIGHGAWGMEHGAWSIGHRAWGIGHGAWSIGHGAGSMGHGEEQEKEGVMEAEVFRYSGIKELGGYGIKGVRVDTA